LRPTTTADDDSGRRYPTDLECYVNFAAVLAESGQKAGPDLAGNAVGPVLDVCRQLLRAAYLGTLMAATGLGRGRVVLTLIGGGAFGNPPRLIWESLTWALAEVEPLLSRDLDVVVNGRNLGAHIDAETLAGAARERGGLLLAWPRTGRVRIHL
jgi:hypothetical protein